MKLSKELAASRIAWPFRSPPFPSFRVSPLGVLPKKVPGAFRLIHHLSFPKGRSVNNGIAAEDTSVRYATVADAIRIIKLAGPGCFLAKTDIKSAFRIIPIHPNDYRLLGMKWRGRFYYDRSMPMGCSSSCKTFETFSTAVECIARHKQKIDKILHLLDDFLFVSSSHTQRQTYLDLFLALCNHIGIPLAPEKNMWSSNNSFFCRYWSEARLPTEKITKCVQSISDFLTRKKVKLKELQSLIGLLNFACSVITPGRAFLRRLIDLTCGATLQHHFIRLRQDTKEDLRVWLSFLSNFNGKSFFLDENWCNSTKLNWFTDASGSIGFGAIFGSEWRYGKWPNQWLHRHIATLEFYQLFLVYACGGTKYKIIAFCVSLLTKL